MNFNQLSYFPGLLVLFGIFLFVVILLEKRFFKIVRTYWFYSRSVFSYLSTFLFLLGMGGLLLSLLDLRGPEEKIKTEVPTNRTIILLDTSASMLAEDVKPSRLQKAVLIAKHFARKAVGQQLSIVAFAEIQKKIVPFTNDLDLIDSRLDSLKTLRNQYGSSALSVAIQESIQYFREIGGEARGNILVLTDGEETAEGIKLNVPKDIHIALVGVGTTQGGRIPLDDARGFRFGYKKENGRDIITKLNENFFKKAAADVPSGKYWLANSYSLPSEEILDFFKGENDKGKDQQDMVIKPVLMEWVVVPSLLLIVCSYFFKFLRVFSLGLFLIVMPLHAQEKEEPQLSPETVQKLGDLQNGKLNHLEKIKLADELREGGSKEEAMALYEENLPLDKIDPNIPTEAYLNYGTSLLEKGEAQKGMAVYDRLLKSVKGTPKEKAVSETVDKNIVSYFKQEEQKKKEQQKKKDNKEGEDKDQQNKDQQGQGQSKDQKNSQSGKQEKQKDQKGQGEDQNKQDKKDQGEDKKDEDKDSEDKNDEQKDKGDKGEQDQKPLPPKKMPAKLKQLMSDDRQLQMKMIENGTRDLNKRKSRKSKDW